LRLVDQSDSAPRIDPTCFVHRSSVIVGDVTMGPNCSVWPCAVIRGDDSFIRIGHSTNIQDNAVIHVDHQHPTHIGDEVSIGHCAMVHGATVQDRCIIGIKAVVLSGCVIGKGSIIGAGAVVTPNTVIPPNSMVVGIPGKVKRSDPVFESQGLENALIYVEMAKLHQRNFFKEYRPG